MSNDYTNEAQAVADAMNSVYENKQQNKKDNIAGDFSSDSASYPTVRAVKNQFGNKVASWSNTPSDLNYASEKLVKGSLDAKASATHTHSATELIDANAYSHIGTSANSTQSTINNAIDERLSSITNIDLITVVSQLPTASAETMNQLYFVAEQTPQQSDNYEIYITVRTGTSPNYSYAWEKVDSARIDLSGYSTTDHTHNNITSDGRIGTNANYFVYTTTGGTITSKQKIGNISTEGKIGTTANLPLITTTGGTVTTGSFGTSSNTFAEGNHTHSNYTTSSDVQSEVQSFANALANAINPSR